MKSTVEIIFTNEQIRQYPVNQWLEAILQSRNFEYETILQTDGSAEVVSVKAIVTIENLDLWKLEGKQYDLKTRNRAMKSVFWLSYQIPVRDI